MARINIAKKIATYILLVVGCVLWANGNQELGGAVGASSYFTM